MTPTDLFCKHKTDKDRLWEWIKEKKYVKTSEILAWGVKNYSNRADRNARQLAQEGKIRRIPPQKKAFYFGNVKEEIWEVINLFNP